ncbi:hypothetical protein Tco_1296550 [Tanacetum coccineum]
MPLSIRPLVHLILIQFSQTGFLLEFKKLNSGSGSNMLRVCTTLSENISFEPLTSAFSGESRYLTLLTVFEKGEELFQSDQSQSTVTGGMSIFLISCLSVTRNLSLFQFENIIPLE